MFFNHPDEKRQQQEAEREAEWEERRKAILVDLEKICSNFMELKDEKSDNYQLVKTLAHTLASYKMEDAQEKIQNIENKIHFFACFVQEEDSLHFSQAAFGNHDHPLAAELRQPGGEATLHFISKNAIEHLIESKEEVVEVKDLKPDAKYIPLVTYVLDTSPYLTKHDTSGQYKFKYALLKDYFQEVNRDEELKNSYPFRR